MAAPPPGPTPGSVPSLPKQRVKFKHPDTGEEADGHIHAAGVHGATIVDHRGATHKVPHGHYQFQGEEQANGKPSAKAVKAAALKHLEHGPDAPLAVYAAAILVSIGGVKTAHALKSEDVVVAKPHVLFRAEKLKTDLAPLVKVLSTLKERSPTGPLFKVDGSPITASALTTYAQRFGGAGLGGRDLRPANPVDQDGQQVQAGGPPPAAPGKAPMAKAAASALDLPEDPEAVAEWSVGRYRCKFAKADTSAIGTLTIEGPDLAVPLHEVVSSGVAARTLAPQLVDDLVHGRAPRRGVFQQVRR